MVFYFRIGNRQYGVKEVPINVKYTLKGRQINFSTDIIAVGIVLLDGNVIKNHWCLRLLIPFHYSSSQSFLFLESFIRTVLITDSVLYSIGAFEPMRFQNKIEDHALHQQEKAALVE